MSDRKPDAAEMARLARSVRATYERHAEAWDKSRNRSLFERRWLERSVQDVPPGGAVLDLGCGTGEPIAAWLLERGFSVTGVDFAEPMLRIASARFPDATWRLADMTTLSLGRQFGAVIGWGSFFHLTEQAQRVALPRIAGHVAKGGRLLLTVGPGAGEATGTVAGETVYHASLDLAEYTKILEAAGLECEDFVPEDPDCAGHTLLLARRKP